ncbi:MAG: hypothetical protein AAGF93_10030 [Cyanobacteria bacterium P01_H01_bin.105]
MNIEHPHAKELTPEEGQHLEKLRTVVKTALTDGTLSEYEVDHIKSLIWADGKVTYEELRTLHATIHSVMGDDVVLPMEWRSS